MENEDRKGIDYFYRDHWLSGIQMWLAYRVRKKMFDLWLARAHLLNLPPRQIVDIGATPDTERPDSNCFLKWMHEAGMAVSCYSPEDISNIVTVFPYVKILPQRKINEIANQSYDWSSSSAVLEHVGNEENQIGFIKEQARIGRSVFLTTPNRCHWLEFHTKIPLLHWLPRKWHRLFLKAIGLDFWALESNLRLVSKKELLWMANQALGPSYDIFVKTVWALGMPSNHVLIATKRTN